MFQTEGEYSSLVEAPAPVLLSTCVFGSICSHCITKNHFSMIWPQKLLHNFTSCSPQSSLALASRSCCRVSLTCIPPELVNASLSGVVAGCRCRQPSGRSSCPVPSATMSSTAAATSPLAWAAPTRCVRPACTNCTARPAPSIRRPSAPILTCCRSTVPCCSWWELRWVRGKEGLVYVASLSPPFFFYVCSWWVSFRSLMCSRWA